MGTYLPSWNLVTVDTKVGFTEFILGTVRPSLTLSRIRQLCDKALSYLKKVIVTSAVHKLLYELNLAFKYLHWAGLTDYTTPYDFAVCYVFEKQSRTLGFKTLCYESKHYAEAYVLICRVPLEWLCHKP